MDRDSIVGLGSLRPILGRQPGRAPAHPSGRRLRSYATGEEILPDSDYADRFLWSTDELLRRSHDEGIRLDPGLAHDVALRCAQITAEDVGMVNRRG